jgi:predicted Zn finger-like uncharacterized protein
MLIVCPNCKKQFEVEDTGAAEERKLRCSSCRAVFRLVRKAAAQVPQAQAAQRRAADAAPAAPVMPTVAAPLAPVATPAVAAPLAPTAAPTAAAASTMVRPAAPAPMSSPTAPASGRLRVVIANESLSFCEAVSKILASEPFELFVCTDGKEALDTVERVTPHLLLLDVALPTMFGFEVCERVRQNPALADVKIVLIASIYDKTRYKRSPKSLYGADDYLEKHHIPDSLIPMIYRLVSGSASLPTAPSCDELALHEKSRTEIRQAEASQTLAAEKETRPALQQAQQEPRPALQQTEQEPRPSLQAELTEVQVKARRLARIIVSDISLYSQAKVEQGVREGTFYALLADDIREGELLYRQRVSESVRETTSYLSDAFEDLIAKKRAELRI